MAGLQAPCSSMGLVSSTSSLASEEQDGLWCRSIVSATPISAAYGHVPLPEAPQQVARDGEDYAVMVTS
eukprot:13081887-Heterocapsa_arctica.AAC.1